MDSAPEHLVDLDPARSLWERVFTVAPLVVIGTREGDGHDLAPKHMVTPLGWSPYFGFVCTPDHATYRNAREHGAFTVTFPRADEAVVTSLTAAPRCEEGGPKPTLAALPTFPADRVDGVFLEHGYLFLECTLHRVVDGFGENSLVTGEVVAARVREEALRTTERDDGDVVRDSSPLVYLDPGRFTDAGESRAFPFPAGFRR